MLKGHLCIKLFNIRSSKTNELKRIEIPPVSNLSLANDRWGSSQSPDKVNGLLPQLPSLQRDPVCCVLLPCPASKPLNPALSSCESFSNKDKPGAFKISPGRITRTTYPSPSPGRNQTHALLINSAKNQQVTS